MPQSQNIPSEVKAGTVVPWDFGLYMGKRDSKSPAARLMLLQQKQRKVTSLVVGKSKVEDNSIHVLLPLFVCSSAYIKSNLYNMYFGNFNFI